jgi:cell division protein FtsI/penicillin-binding protein 2
MAKKTMKTDTVQRKRIMLLMALLGVVCFLAVFVRLFWLQIIRYDFFTDKALSQQTSDKVLYPVRGTIYDAKGKPLAISASTEMVTLEALKIDHPEQGLLIARGLSEILDLDYETVLAKVEKKENCTGQTLLQAKFCYQYRNAGSVGKILPVMASGDETGAYFKGAYYFAS